MFLIDICSDRDTITISDRGIGLTAEEIEKYINQIAFSGANDFLEKYKDDANAIWLMYFSISSAVRQYHGQR